MAHVHDHGGSTTVVSDGEGPATALVVLIALVIIGVLIWFFAFSGVVFNRNGGSDNPDINIRNQNPLAQQNNTNNQQPAPAQS